MTGSSNTSTDLNSTLYPDPRTASSYATPTITSTGPAQTQTSTASNDLGSLVESIISGLDGCNFSTDAVLGEIIEVVVKNITSSIENDLGSFFKQLLQNVTVGFETALTNGTLSSFLDDIIQDISSSTTGMGLLGSLTSSGGELEQFFQGVLGNFTTGIASGLSKAEGTAAKGITNALGIEQFYSLHLRTVCAGSLSSPSDPSATFHIAGCFSYSEAATGRLFLLFMNVTKILIIGFANLIASVPSSTTVLSTNISIPAIVQVPEIALYLTALTDTLDKVIFSFYIISIIGSSAVIFGSLVAFLFPSSAGIMYSNLAFSIISVLFNLAGSATVTAFITTASNIVNLFGSSLGLVARLGTNFIILTWTSFGLALLTNLYILAIWFFQFRTVSVTVQRRPSPRPVPLQETSEDSIFRSSRVSGSRMSRQTRGSKYADF